jgi:hypothetical protein
MKNLFFSFLLFAGISFTASAQEQKVATGEKTSEISFEKELHDFGTLDYAADGTYAFKFTNTGDENLVISNCQGSCGCTVPKWPREPILKGQSAYITVSYDTKRPGPFTKTVTVTSNAKSPTKVLTIKGEVRTQAETENMVPVRLDNGMSPLANPTK